MELQVQPVQKEVYAYNNILNHSKHDFSGKKIVFLKMLDSMYVSQATDLESGFIGVGNVLRSRYSLQLLTRIVVEEVEPNSKAQVNKIKFHISRHGKKHTTIMNFHEDLVKEQIIKKFRDHYFYENQVLLFDFEGSNLVLTVGIPNGRKGRMRRDCIITLDSDDVVVNLVGSKLLKRDLFKDNYNFEELGIGGMDNKLVNIIRRALSTRAIPQDKIKALGIKHIKGVLLYGPPGTGKTLIARKIGGMISNKEPKVVNGPEILDKFVGESEKNIRNLFADALVDKDELHIIIFDEIDAICRTRGRTGTTSTISDNIVSQLLAIMDGIHELDNIFVIAMTNRIDLLDPALLRPGRIEIHVEINLPDFNGRCQIFRIHTKSMRNSHMVDQLDIEKLANLTDNFSGAEIEAVVKDAASHALHQLLGSEEKNIEDKIVVKMEHFIKAVDEIVPAFGNNNAEIRNIIPNNYVENLTKDHTNCYQKIVECINKNRRLTTILVCGENGSGKTTLVAKVAEDSKVKFTKMVRAINMISMDELSKSQHLADAVQNGYNSDKSLVIIDDLEVAINYAKLGTNLSFSNKLYQTLVTILKTPPPNPNHSMVIICICGQPDLANTIRIQFDYVLMPDMLEEDDFKRVSAELGTQCVNFHKQITIKDMINIG